MNHSISLSILMAPKHRQPAAMPAAEENPAAAGRVLVVDDDAGSRSLLAEWLSAYGHQVTTAADGPEALLAVERESRCASG